MSKFITADENSQKLKDLLSGRFSKTEVALPVPNWGGGTLKAGITFQIYQLNEIKKPNAVRIFLQLMRLDLIPLTLLPALVVLLFTPIKIDLFSVFVLGGSLLFLHTAAFAFNDYFDHMRGRDYINEKSGRRVIQKGYLKAHSVLKMAWMMWTGALLGGLYLAWAEPRILFFALTGALLGALGSTYSKFSFKAVGLSDFSVFLGLGPLLLLSVEYVLSGQMSYFIFKIGFIYGLLAVLYSQSLSLQSAMTDHQAQIKTVAVRLGFDRMKIWLGFQAFFVMGLCVLFFSPAYFYLSVILGFPACVFILKIRKTKSSVSSAAEGLPVQILKIHLSWTIALFIFYSLQGFS